MLPGVARNLNKRSLSSDGTSLALCFVVEGLQRFAIDKKIFAMAEGTRTERFLILVCSTTNDIATQVG